MAPRKKAKKNTPHPRRALSLLTVALLALIAGIGYTTTQDPAGQWSPKLGLDLEGGRQIVLQAQVETNSAGKAQAVNAEQLQQAVDILRNRIDGTGVAEAQVSTLGQSNIVIEIPGKPSQQLVDSLSRSAKLNFRAVIESRQLGRQAPQIPSVFDTQMAEAKKAQAEADKAAKKSSSAPQNTSQPAATPVPSVSGPGGSHAPGASDDKPKNASDPAWAKTVVENTWVSSGFAKADTTYAELYASARCTAEFQSVAARASLGSRAAKYPVVMCASDGSEVYLLGPSEVDGTQITNASSGPETNNQGQQTGATAVSLEFNDAGTKAFGAVTKRLAGYQGAQNTFAITVDGAVIEAAGVREPITTGKAQITGGFTPESGSLLANSLKYGALPFTFQALTSEQISPQLGASQLQLGIIFGLIGLLLVVIYSLLQYRALGLVTVASLLVAAAFAYTAVTFLGWALNFRLTMAGVTGLIVAIGITADSFIVYFERIRDEVRAGRPLVAAVETGWARARRTIIISDAVNLMAAVVLYALSESTVKAFAFTLGLTTIIDLLVVLAFTHPMVSLLAHTKFFGGGHPLSGLSPERLGAQGVRYSGRGRLTIAERRAGKESTDV